MTMDATPDHLDPDHLDDGILSALLDGDDAAAGAGPDVAAHLRACDRMDVNPDVAAVREIIDDALNGRRVFAETFNNAA